MYSCTTWRDSWKFIDALVCALHWMGHIDNIREADGIDLSFQSLVSDKSPVLLEALHLAVYDWGLLRLAYDEADATSSHWGRDWHSSDKQYADWLKSVAECKYANDWQKQRIKEILGEGGEDSKKNGYIYLLGCDEGYYKIGRAKNVSSRLARFEVIFPFDFSLIHSFEADDYYAAETELHHDFAEQRANGEWFILSDAEVSKIKSILGYQGGVFVTENDNRERISEPTKARQGLDTMKRRFGE